MNILIVGYGNIGRHIFEEFKCLQPDIYDPYQKKYEIKQNKQYDIAFICVPTDCNPNGSCDTSIVEQAVAETDAEIIVIKSTVPPGTTQRLIGATGKKIVFSPEHYGVTQHCKTDPGFVILGGEKELTAKVAQVYAKVKNGYYQIRFTDATTAELSKYMLNSFLALKVTFCNEFADLATKFDVSYPELRELFILDERVGASHTFVYPDKPFYDSHCFNKDVPALVQFADGKAPLLAAMNDINLARKAKSGTNQKTETEPLSVIQNEIEKVVIEIEELKKAERKAFIVFAENGRTPEAEQNLKAAIEKRERKEQELELLHSARLDRLRRERLDKIAQTKFQYDCSVCLIIRDENEYLSEWLNWHIGQGVQHFYIYDHGSKQPVEQFIQSLGAEIAARVTVTDWSGSHENAQPDAYNDCLARFGHESRWLGFIDADEHVRVKTGQKLPEFLKGYSEHAGIMAIWEEYGANGQKHKSGIPLRQRFTKLSSRQAQLGKVFIQPLLLENMYIHYGIPAEGFNIVGEYDDAVVTVGQNRYENPSSDLICIDHYYTKSYEEWLDKLRRGRCHFNHARQYGHFFTYNPDMEYCYEDIKIEQKYEVSEKAV